jgi:hypothetical protein
MKTDKFIITASQDFNINLHRLSDGVFIGQFGKPEAPGSSKCWDLLNMQKYSHRKPRYVREWYLALKKLKLDIRRKQEEA